MTKFRPECFGIILGGFSTIGEGFIAVDTSNALAKSAIISGKAPTDHDLPAGFN